MTTAFTTIIRATKMNITIRKEVFSSDAKPELTASDSRLSKMAVMMKMISVRVFCPSSEVMCL